MNKLDSTIETRLKNLAFRESIPFCYGCYQEAPRGRCPTCNSDDLMRLVPGVGCEWGIDWVMDSLIEQNVTPADVDSSFEDSISQCYEETIKVGWLELDLVRVLKEMDPISWDMAKSEWIDNEVEDGILVEFDYGKHFWKHDIETFLDDSEPEVEEVG